MDSRVVTHPSTNIAWRSLTSLIGREAVLSPQYGRIQKSSSLSCSVLLSHSSSSCLSCSVRRSRLVFLSWKKNPKEMKSGGLPRLVPFSLPSCKRVSLRAHPLPFLKRVTLATSPWLCRPHFCSSPSFSTHTNGVNEDTEDGGPKPDEHFRHSQLNSMFRWLNERGPAFEVDPHRVQFLEQPSQFLDRLEEGIKQAQHRVVLSALYLGTSSPQVDRLMAALHSACRANSQLQVHLHFDHCRSTRDPKGLEELQRLQAAFPERMKVTLFQVPAPLWWQWGHRLVPSPRFKEVFGLSHIKAFLFDDDLILSGANLSTDYFTDRKDRYMVMEQAPALAHFFSRLMETVGDLSWHLDPRSKQVESNALLPKEEANKRLSSLLRDSSRLHPLPSSSSPPLNKQKGGATWVLPTLQMAPFGIRHDEEITSFLFRGSCDSSPSPPLSTFHISSAYLNFTERYTQDLLHFPSQPTKQSIEILTAAPEANSFFGGSGVARHITHCYTCLERALFERIRSAGLENSIRLYEWQQGGPSSKKWTYHAKGLWLSPSPSSSSARVTILGSPNFGKRSVERDLEASVVLLTEDAALAERLDKERESLWEHAKPVTEELFQRADRQPAAWLPYLTPYLSSFF